MSLFQVVNGNPATGFRFIGPFTNPHHAAEWADEWLTDSDWWIVTLQSNKEYENECNKDQVSRGV